jgi:hypothetical protein
MAASTGRLRLAPDDHSGGLLGATQTKERPRCIPGALTPGAGPGRHSTATKVPTMAKSTRGPDPVDRWTRISGVNITPPTQPGPVTTTRTVA